MGYAAPRVTENLLISLIPLVGSIILLVFNVQDSQPGDNQFGPNPKTSRVA
jgi:uncharacterized membrane protein YhaH (DUF805 family)